MDPSSRGRFVETPEMLHSLVCVLLFIDTAVRGQARQVPAHLTFYSSQRSSSRRSLPFQGTSSDGSRCAGGGCGLRQACGAACWCWWDWIWPSSHPQDISIAVHGDLMHSLNYHLLLLLVARRSLLCFSNYDLRFHGARWELQKVLEAFFVWEGTVLTLPGSSTAALISSRAYVFAAFFRVSVQPLRSRSL